MVVNGYTSTRHCGGVVHTHIYSLLQSGMQSEVMNHAKPVPKYVYLKVHNDKM